MTMILATHEMGFCRDISDTVCFLEGGVMLEKGPPKKVFSPIPEHARTTGLPAGGAGLGAALTRRPRTVTGHPLPKGVPSWDPDHVGPLLPGEIPSKDISHSGPSQE